MTILVDLDAKLKRIEVIMHDEASIQFRNSTNFNANIRLSLAEAEELIKKLKTQVKNLKEIAE